MNNILHNIMLNADSIFSAHGSTEPAVSSLCGCGNADCYNLPSIQCAHRCQARVLDWNVAVPESFSCVDVLGEERFDMVCISSDASSFLYGAT